MNIYTCSEAQEKLPLLLNQVIQEGEVRIRMNDGQIFIIKPEIKPDSPLNVEGIELNISTSEIVEIIREGREQLKSEDSDIADSVMVRQC